MVVVVEVVVVVVVGVGAVLLMLLPSAGLSIPQCLHCDPRTITRDCGGFLENALGTQFNNRCHVNEVARNGEVSSDVRCNSF